MTSENGNTFRDSLLNGRRLREIIREARTGFAPDHVALALRHRHADLVDYNAGEVLDQFATLACEARVRLNDAGLEPQFDEAKDAFKIPKREREYALNMAVLLTWLGGAHSVIGNVNEAHSALREGIAWCRLAGDHHQMALLWRGIAPEYKEMSMPVEEEDAYRCSIASARACGDPVELAISLNALCSVLVNRHRLEEAGEVNRETLEVMRGHENEGRAIYAMVLMNEARLVLIQSRYAEGIRMLREALHWADADTDPMGRLTIYLHLGATYLKLQQYRQCIEYQHEVVKLAAAAGSEMARSWGYFKLADAHLRLNEFDQADHMLDRTAEYSGNCRSVFAFLVPAKRADICLARGAYDETGDLCRALIEQIGSRPMPDLELFARKCLAEIEDRNGRLDESIAYFQRALELAEQSQPARGPAIRISMAAAYHHHGHDAEAQALLDEVTGHAMLQPGDEARLLHMKASIAEAAGDFRAALEYDRDAFAVERTVLERQAELSLRNARIVAETDLLEREADLERERRRRVERDLADAVVQLGDRKRVVETVEQKLRAALGTAAGSDREQGIARAMHETLAELRARPSTSASPLHYLGAVDDEFYTRLRAVCPDLTTKQERLCGLLRAGLSSKDISTLLGIGPEGLKTLRKRLRKKLNLEAEAKLETVLAEM